MEWISSLFLRDWSRKLAPPFQPIVCNDKTNRALVSCEFPRLKAVSFNYPDFRFAYCDTKLSSLLSLLFFFGRCYISFWFYDAHLKGTLLSKIVHWTKNSFGFPTKLVLVFVF